ncbi:MAG: methionyl-tRNA formyltransferase [Candidatus Margulisiibacteriota bacterium]|jgi:methionyl-tRNA formyltransferase
MKLVYFGTPEPAADVLAGLLKAGLTPALVVTQPDRPKGRGQIVGHSPVKEIALDHNLPLEQPERVRNNPVFKALLESIKPDLCIVVAYGQILPADILAIPRLGFINLHASLLPKYRGAAPVQWALINGEKESGVTVIRLTEELDAGPILARQAVLITPEDNAETYLRKAFVAGQELLLNLLPKLEAGEVRSIEQNEAEVTYAPTLKKESGAIDWRKSAVEIANLVRGTLPWPVAHTIYRGRQLKLFNVQTVDLPEIAPHRTVGEIVAIIKGEGLVIATGLGHLLIKEVQLDGGKRMSCASFLAGHDVEIGETLPN